MKMKNPPNFFDHRRIVIQVVICRDYQLGFRTIEMPAGVCDQAVCDLAPKLGNQLLIIA
jgi:hypothetical protein